MLCIGRIGTVAGKSESEVLEGSVMARLIEIRAQHELSCIKLVHVTFYASRVFLASHDAVQRVFRVPPFESGVLPVATTATKRSC